MTDILKVREQLLQQQKAVNRGIEGYEKEIEQTDGQIRQLEKRKGEALVALERSIARRHELAQYLTDVDAKIHEMGDEAKRIEDELVFLRQQLRGE